MDLTIQPQPIGGVLQRLVDVLGVVEGVDLFNGPAVPPMNEQGVVQLSVIAYGGAPPDGTHNQGLSVLRRSAFQVIGRHEDYDVAYAAAESAREALVVTDVVLRGLYFLRISPRSELTDLPLDPQRRARVVFSIETVTRLVPPGSSLKRTEVDVLLTGGVDASEGTQTKSEETQR